MFRVFGIEGILKKRLFESPSAAGRLVVLTSKGDLQVPSAL